MICRRLIWASESNSNISLEFIVMMSCFCFVEYAYFTVIALPGNILAFAAIILAIRCTIHILKLPSS